MRVGDRCGTQVWAGEDSELDDPVDDQGKADGILFFTEEA